MSIALKHKSIKDTNDIFILYDFILNNDNWSIFSLSAKDGDLDF